MTEPVPVRFGVFEIDLRAHELRKHGVRLKLQEQPFQVLQTLVERPGELVTREELQHRVWGDGTFVDFEQSLNRAVNKLREALSDDAHTPRYIETVPRRGYRFIAPVDGIVKVDSRSLPEPVLFVPRKSYRRFVSIGTSLLVLAGAALWIMFTRESVPPPHVVPLTTLSGQQNVPAFSPDGKMVAFTWNGPKGDNFDIYVKAVGGGPELRITDDAAVDTRPSWSPDGRQIAFVSSRGDGGIYLVSPQGGPQRKVASFQGSGQLSWSRDGKNLLMARRYREQNQQIDDGAVFVIPVEGVGAPRRILKPPAGSWYADAALSPDGRSIGLALRTGSQSGPTCSLQVTALDDSLLPSGKLRQIVAPPWIIVGIAWMPNSKSLLFSGSRGDIYSTLWRVNVRAGSKPEALEFAGDSVSAAAVDHSGHRVVFMRSEVNFDIWCLEFGGKSAPLLTSTMRDVNPQYSPDGSRVVWESARLGRPAVWVADGDGSNAIQVSRREDSHSGTPRWSPDGRRIAYDSAGKGGGWDIWVVEAGGSSPRQLTQGPADNIIPSWSSDGNSIYFASKRSGRFEIWRMPVDGGAATEVTRNGGYTAFEALDGKTLFYTLSEGGSEGLYTKILPDGAETQFIKERVAYRGFVVVSDGVYYLHPTWQTVNVPNQSMCDIRFQKFVEQKAQTVAEIEEPVYFGLSVSPDRKKFLFSKSRTAEQNLKVIENFR